MKTAIQIRPEDHVATATADVGAGEEVRVTGIRDDHVVTAREAIRAGHKLALRRVPSGGEILKYGEVIGAATEGIEEGNWVHVHNCRGIKARRHDGAA